MYQRVQCTYACFSALEPLLIHVYSSCSTPCGQSPPKPACYSSSPPPLCVCLSPLCPSNPPSRLDGDPGCGGAASAPAAAAKPPWPCCCSLGTRMNTFVSCFGPCPCGSCPVQALLPGPRLGLGLCSYRAAGSSQRVQTLPPAVYPGTNSGAEHVVPVEKQILTRVQRTAAKTIDRGHRGHAALDRLVLGLVTVAPPQRMGRPVFSAQGDPVSVH